MDENTKKVVGRPDISKRPDFKEITAKGGRNKAGSVSIKKLIHQVWNEEIIDDNGNPTIRALLSVKALIKKAEGGDVNAFKELVTRGEGLPKQEVEHSTKEGTKIEIVHEYPKICPDKETTTSERVSDE